MQGAGKEDPSEDSTVTGGFIVIDEPFQGLKRGDFHGIQACLGTPKESTLACPQEDSEVDGLRRFILSADWHLVGTTPAARRDPDWLEAQREALRFLVRLAVECSCPLVAVGDLFEAAKIATPVVNMALEELNVLRDHGQELYFIEGNHDLLDHLAASFRKCSVGTIGNVFPRIPQIDGIQDAQPFGMDKDTGAAVVFTHQLVFKDEDSRPPMSKGRTAQELLDSLPSAQWVFVGDLHHSFHYVSPDGRNVVSPGNMIAHNASMIEVEAKCAIIDLDSETPVTWIAIPDDPAMLTRDHLDTKAAKEDRLSGFLERVKDAGTTSLTFKDKLESRMGLQDITEAQTRAYTAIKAQATVEEK